jgi:NADH-quinone oxidoreductase subunit M
MVNHGLSTVMLFLVVGWMISRRGSARWEDYGGVQGPAPVLAGVFLFASLATVSLPGLATFVSEFLVLVGTYSRYLVAGGIATLGIVLAAVYMLLLYQRTMTGPVREQVAGFRDLHRTELVAAAPLIALVLVLGVYPKPLLDVIDHGVAPTLEQAGVSDPPPVVEAAREGSAP